MKSNQTEYLPITESAGVRVSVHGQSEEPFPDAFGYNAAAGFTTSFGIKFVSLSLSFALTSSLIVVLFRSEQPDFLRLTGIARTRKDQAPTTTREPMPLRAASEVVSRSTSKMNAAVTIRDSEVRTPNSAAPPTVRFVP